MTEAESANAQTVNRLRAGVVWVLILAGSCLGLPVTSSASETPPDTATQELRHFLENQFKGVTGLGFKAFRCEYPVTWPTSRELTCYATDEENDRFIYQIASRAGEEDPFVSMMQPVEQLNPSGLSAISRPCEAFLEAFAQANWEGALAALSTELGEQLGIAGLRDILAPLRSELGTVAEPMARYYASPSQGLHQIEYAMDTGAGQAVGRFRLRIDSQNNPQIVSFLVTAEPGSALQAVLLERVGKEVLGQFFDQPINKIVGPLEELRYIGDNAELELTLQDGSSIMARIEQHGSTSDVDSNDYRFQVLDARTIIGLHLASRDQSVKTIDCPSNVAPDGGHVDCAVTFAGGTSTTMRLMRRGGSHRLVEAQ